MKRKVFGGIAVLSIAAVAAMIVSFSANSNNWSDVSLNKIEANANCEIKNKKGEVVFSCSGDESCSDTTLGYTLTCDGTKN